MAIQMRSLSQQTIEEAHAMAQQSSTWARGRSKRAVRLTFWIIPSRSKPGTAHYTTSYGCTCKGFRRRGDCAHAEAVRMVEARKLAESATEAAPVSLMSYRQLYPACQICSDLCDSSTDRLCERCSSEAAHQQRLASKRAVRVGV